jgi:hypothetical protein
VTDGTLKSRWEAVAVMTADRGEYRQAAGAIELPSDEGL